MNDAVINNLPVNSLGPYPLLQLAAAIVILMGLTFAIYRGTRDRSGNAGAPLIPPEQRWFFDGPLTVAVNLLRDCRNHLERIVEALDDVPEELRKQTEIMRDIKSELDRHRDHR